MARCSAASAGEATIGGVFACNLAGPRRIKAGAARDHLLGVQAVTGRGDLIKSGGRVVKNVTGYDLSKLLAGSFGTLAVMTELTFKVLPAAAETCTLLLAGLERERAFAALRQALGSAHEVAGAAYLPAAAAGRSAVAAVAAAAAGVVALRLEGPAPSVRYRADALSGLLATVGGDFDRLDAAASATLWREIRDAALLPAQAPALWRVSLAPSAGSALIDALERRAGPRLARRLGRRPALACGPGCGGRECRGRRECRGWRCGRDPRGARRTRRPRDPDPRQSGAARGRAGVPAAGAGARPPDRAGQGQFRSQAHSQSRPDVCGPLSPPAGRGR